MSGVLDFNLGIHHVFSHSAVMVLVCAMCVKLFVTVCHCNWCYHLISCLCRTGAQRARIINKFADLLEANLEELAQLETLVTILCHGNIPRRILPTCILCVRTPE